MSVGVYTKKGDTNKVLSILIVTSVTDITKRGGDKKLGSR